MPSNFSFLDIGVPYLLLNTSWTIYGPRLLQLLIFFLVWWWVSLSGLWPRWKSPPTRLLRMSNFLFKPFVKFPDRSRRRKEGNHTTKYKECSHRTTCRTDCCSYLWALPVICSRACQPLCSFFLSVQFAYWSISWKDRSRWFWLLICRRWFQIKSSQVSNRDGQCYAGGSSWRRAEFVWKSSQRTALRNTLSPRSSRTAHRPDIALLLSKRFSCPQSTRRAWGPAGDLVFAEFWPRSQTSPSSLSFSC